MSSHGPADPPAPQPSQAAFEALASDDWAAILPDLRAAMRDVGETDDGEVAPLRDAPVGKLAGGRGRRDLIRLLSSHEAVWEHACARLLQRDDLPTSVRALLDPTGGEADGKGAAAAGDAEPSRGDRQRARVRALTEERDAWRRRAQGAEARADGLLAEAARLREDVEAAREEAARLRRRLDEAAAERTRAVDRERRRRDAEVTELTRELASLRRADEERKAAERRRQQRPPEGTSAPLTAPTGDVPTSTRLIPGRPSRLPEGVAAGTSEAVALLLHAGRLVLVDGYNLTRQHRAGLDLDQQRAWLVQVLSNLAARRRVRPVAVFDGTRASGSRPPAGAREVEVRFTETGITADDEIVLAVEGTDEPVLVVTDDRELTSRVRAVGADVVGTKPFLWVAG